MTHSIFKPLIINTTTFNTQHLYSNFALPVVGSNNKNIKFAKNSFWKMNHFNNPAP